MKFLKWFSLFFMSVFIAFVAGILIGLRLETYVYPKGVEQNMAVGDNESVILSEAAQPKETAQVVATSGNEVKISGDTVYVVIERNMDTGEEVETISRFSDEYLGMGREQFIASMEDYEANPPVTELERGFVSLEVQSFSGTRVEVLMNYSYVKPGKSFYIVVYDGLLTVLLEDGETVYLNTGIRVPDLPESVQMEIIQGMFVEDEESLYDFLENYTS